MSLFGLLQAPSAPGWMWAVPYLLVFGILWLLIIRPQLKQQQRHRDNAAESWDDPEDHPDRHPKEDGGHRGRLKHADESVRECFKHGSPVRRSDRGVLVSPTVALS